MPKIYYSDIPQNNFSISQYIFQKTRPVDVSAALKNLTFYEFTLEELGLPTAEILLDRVLHIEQQVGLQNWVNRTKLNRYYKGFSLTYNPNYCDNIKSIYHQTMGSNQLTQNYSRNNQTDIKIKDTYYDTYGFRKIPPIVKESLFDFIDKFYFSFFRSRVAYFSPIVPNNGKGEDWHIDEAPYELLRINIPLQTSEEHLLDIDGSDDIGNKFCLKAKHLEIGKAYIWNTRIPHRVYINKIVKSFEPRIHMVLGLSPWITYNDIDDSFEESKHHNVPIHEIVENKLFLRSTDS
jgi:hypothetical protein